MRPGIFAITHREPRRGGTRRCTLRLQRAEPIRSDILLRTKETSMPPLRGSRRVRDVIVPGLTACAKSMPGLRPCETVSMENSGSHLRLSFSIQARIAPRVQQNEHVTPHFVRRSLAALRSKAFSPEGAASPQPRPSGLGLSPSHFASPGGAASRRCTLRLQRAEPDSKRHPSPHQRNLDAAPPGLQESSRRHDPRPYGLR